MTTADLARFQAVLALDPVDMARDLSIPEARLMDLLREIEAPSEEEVRQIEEGCLREYGVTPAALERT